MAKLGVNVDHVAAVRQARLGKEPDPVVAAILAEIGGADGIVVHLREDRRHIQERDLRLLREIVKGHLNLEMAAEESVVNIALDVKPDTVTLVPERRNELTTEGGLNVAANLDTLEPVVHALHDVGIIVSFFVDPEPAQIKAAARLLADRVEIHTGHYADTEDQATALHSIQAAATLAERLNLGVSAGHGLNYRNVGPIVRIREITELNIGHSIIAHALFVGIEQAVRQMRVLTR